MTPLILLILAAMWAAVLLPPYLRDRNETKAAGSQGAVRNRIEALTSSVSGGRSYLPVGSSGQSASQVPLPPGARQAVAAPAAERMPTSSAVQVLDGTGRPARSTEVPRLRPVGEPAPQAVEPAAEAVVATEAPTRRDPGSGSALARRRRRDVLHALMGIAGITLVAALGLGGGPLLYLHLLADVALIGFVYLLVQRRKVSAEQEMKVAFLPHGGTGASATALLADGGGWNPGHSVDNIRVLRAEAN